MYIKVLLEGSISCLLRREENGQRWEYAFANGAVHLRSACGLKQQERLNEIMADPEFDRTLTKSVKKNQN